MNSIRDATAALIVGDTILEEMKKQIGEEEYNKIALTDGEQKGISSLAKGTSKNENTSSKQ